MIEINDTNYWEGYYKKNVAPEEPSLFAEHIIENYMDKTKKPILVELGCGNGRDARYFASHRAKVLAIDQCAEELKVLTDKNGNNPEYMTADFTRLQDLQHKADIIYSRFTLHSVSEEGQQRTLDWSVRNLETGGLLCIETRGQKNELFKLGDPVDGDPYAYIYNDHYRRFVELGKFVCEIENKGFKIIESAERTGFAPFEDTDYHFIRVVAERS